MQLITNQPVINAGPMNAATRALIDDLTTNVITDIWDKESVVIQAILNDELMDIDQKFMLINNALARFQSVRIGYSGGKSFGSPFPPGQSGYSHNPHFRNISTPLGNYRPPESGFRQLAPIKYHTVSGKVIVIRGNNASNIIHNLSVSTPDEPHGCEHHTALTHAIIDEEDVVGIAVGPLSTDLLVLDEKICEYIFDYLIKIPDLTMFQHHLTYAVRDTRLGKMLSINLAEDSEFDEDADEFWANVQQMFKPMEYSELYD